MLVMRKLFIWFSLFALQANAQQINWVKQSFNKAKNLGLGTPNTWFTPNGNFFYVNSYGDSAQTDTGAVFRGAQESNAVISYINAKGVVLQEFNIEGISPPTTASPYIHALLYSVLNDTEVVFLAPTQNVYINGVKRMDSLVFNSYHTATSLYKLSKTGLLSAIITLPIRSYGNIKYGTGTQIGTNNSMSLSVDTITQRAFVMFSCSESADTTVFDSDYVKPNTSSVFQVNLNTGAIDKHWIFPAEFDGVSILGDDIILSGRSQGLNYEYTVDGISYARDSSADLLTNDILLASFNTVTNIFNWHKMYKIKSPYDRVNLVTSYAIGQSVYVQFRHQDTVTINGVVYGSVIPFNTQEYDLVLAINAAGVKWGNSFKGGKVQFVFKATNQSSGVSYSVYTTSDLTMNTIPIPKSIVNGYNYIAVSEFGALDRSLNAGFGSVKNKGDIFGVNYTDSTLIIGVSLTDSDSLLLKGKYYSKKRKGGYFAEDLLLSFRSSSSLVPTGLDKNPLGSINKVMVYPNPAHTQLRITGIDMTGNVTVCIYDMMGKQHLSKMQYSDEGFNISTLPPGAYFVQINTSTINQTLKLIVD
jgi:hypothetical protein